MAPLQKLASLIGTVTAAFELPAERVEEIRREADLGGKVLPRFTVEVLDQERQPIARVEKTLYVRRRREERDAAGAPSPLTRERVGSELSGSACGARPTPSRAA